MSGKEIALFKLRSTGETVAIKVDRSWQTMIETLAQKFDLKQPSIRLHLKIAATDAATKGMSKLVSIRLSQSSWPECLTLPETHQQNDNTQRVFVEGVTAVEQTQGCGTDLCCRRKRSASLDAQLESEPQSRPQPESESESESDNHHESKRLKVTSSLRQGMTETDAKDQKLIKLVFHLESGDSTTYLVKPHTPMSKVFKVIEARYNLDRESTRYVDWVRGRIERDVSVAMNGLAAEYDGGFPVKNIEVLIEQYGGKPVIYLYPSQPLEISVNIALCPEWSFSALYPLTAPKHNFEEGRWEQASWVVNADPTGLLKDKKTDLEVSYLFWEAHTCKDLTWTDTADPPLFRPAHSRLSADDANVVVLSVPNVPGYLDAALESLGLHTEARTSFITYWLPALLRHQHVALQFLPQGQYERAARLDIDPLPEVVTRVFMVFQGIKSSDLDMWKSAKELGRADVTLWREHTQVPSEERQMDTSLFRVLEWGGMEIK